MAQPAQAHASSLTGFAGTIEAEIEALRQFLQILQSEHQALTQGKIDKLVEFARAKSEQGVRLSQLGANHNRLLSQNRLESTPEGLRQLILREDPDGKHGLAERWEKLMELAQQAQDMNRLNGAMIEAQLKHNQQALAILQEAAKQTSLYGPDGHSRALGMGRRLGKI